MLSCLQLKDGPILVENLRSSKAKSLIASANRSPRLRFTDSFRILELLPATSRSDPLRCRLSVHRINDLSQKYEALSYVWGELSDTVNLNCDHVWIKISRNLDDALRHLRYRASSRYLWIDAICTYSNRSRIKSLRNLRCLFPLDGPNQYQYVVLPSSGNTAFASPCPRSSYQYGHLSLFRTCVSFRSRQHR